MLWFYWVNVIATEAAEVQNDHVWPLSIEWWKVMLAFFKMMIGKTNCQLTTVRSLLWLTKLLAMAPRCVIEHCSLVEPLATLKVCRSSRHSDSFSSASRERISAVCSSVSYYR